MVHHSIKLCNMRMFLNQSLVFRMGWRPANSDQCRGRPEQHVQGYLIVDIILDIVLDVIVQYVL